MKRKIQIVNATTGEVRWINDNDVVPDGFGLKAGSLYLMDALQTEIARSRVTDATNLVDGLGRKAGHRPGFVYDGGNESAARQAHAEMCRRNQTAWVSDAANPMWPGPWSGPHNPAPKPGDGTVSTSSGRAAYVDYISNAWKSGGTGPATDLSQRLPANEWRDRNPKELPKDRTLDAAPDADASYREMVARVSSASTRCTRVQWRRSSGPMSPWACCRACGCGSRACRTIRKWS